MTSPYDLFKTDASAERAGIVLDYGAFSIKIARAGGANRAYLEALADLRERHQRQLTAGVMDDATWRRLVMEVVVRHVVLGWENVTDAAGQAMPFSQDNAMTLFGDLPELYADVTDQAGRVANFRAQRLEEKAGNSPTPSAGS